MRGPALKGWKMNGLAVMTLTRCSNKRVKTDELLTRGRKRRRMEAAPHPAICQGRTSSHPDPTATSSSAC